MTSNTMVSVVVATRNRVELLRHCLEAIAAQTHSSLEVVVVDDGSDAETLTAYPSLCPSLEGRLRWLLPACPGAHRTGPAAARNRGLAAASAPFVAFCDDDDRWTCRDHLACGVRALESTGADFYFTNLAATRDGLLSDHQWFPELERLTAGRPVCATPNVYSSDLATVLRVVADRVIHPDCWLVRRSLLQDVGGFWERIWLSEDYDLMMRVLDRARRILFRPDACVQYRLPVADSVSLLPSSVESILQEVMAAQHARVVCRHAVVRRCARSREAWGLRRLARELAAQGRGLEARRFALQGLCTYPTLGALKQVVIG